LPSRPNFPQRVLMKHEEENFNANPLYRTSNRM
jgi:hypothetical protein